MSRKTIAWVVFGGAVAASLLLYLVTQSVWTPPVEVWAETHGAWAYWLEVFEGHAAAMAVTFAVLGVGAGACLVAWYLGERAGVAAAITLMFAPPVWNAATRSGIAALDFGWVMIGLLVLQWLGYRILAKARQAKTAEKSVTGEIAGERGKPSGRSLIAQYAFIGAAAVFALWSAANHEYRYGMAEQVYERDVVEAADGRWIVSVERESEAGRRALVERVRKAFPEDRELQALAQIGEAAFFEAAVKKYPERFYVKSVGLAGSALGADRGAAGVRALPMWTRRWEHVQPYLDCEDPFIPRMRRLFAFEGNAIGNALQDEGRADEAWELYRRIFTEIEPKNFAALVNMSEMIRRGYAVCRDEQLKVNLALEEFFKDRQRADRVREIVLAAGPVRTDEELIAKMKAEMLRRIEEKRRNHEPLPVSPETRKLVEWNNEMVGCANRGDMGAAGRIARTILSNPGWRGFIPANAILGSVLAQEGDFEASERFFRTAVATTNAVPAAVMNDFAETLRIRGKYEEAEIWARKAVAATTPEFWVARLTLAETLIDAGRGQEEARELLKGLSANVPKESKGVVDGVRRRFLRDKAGKAGCTPLIDEVTREVERKQ